MSNPSLEHYKYLNYTFSYILRTKDYGLDLTLKSIEQSNNNSTIKPNINLNNIINLIGVSDFY
jgi:hypothetical protein